MLNKNALKGQRVLLFKRQISVCLSFVLSKLAAPFPFSLGISAISQQHYSADPGEANVSFPDGKLPAWWCSTERLPGNSLCCRSKRTSLHHTPCVHALFTTADEATRKEVSETLLKCLFRWCQVST